MEAALDHLLRSRFAVAVVTRAGARVVVVNAAFDALAGDHLGRTVPSTIASPRALEHGARSTFTEITTATRADGVVTRVVVSVAPLRDGSKEPRHCIVLLREVHDDRASFECKSA